MHHKRPIWFQNWRYPEANYSSARILAIIPAPSHYFRSSKVSDFGSSSEYDFFIKKTLPTSHMLGTSSEMSPMVEAFGLDETPSKDLIKIGQIDSNWVLFYLFNVPVTGEKLAYALIILLITFLLISTSLLTICAIVTSGSCRDIVGHYFISLAITDLLWGTLVTPMSFYAAILGDDWTFDQGGILCRLEAYIEVTLFTCTTYTFMWIGVDRYAALTRPSRYEAEQSATRCKCWITFTWITAALLCCPTLFGEQNQARPYKDVFLCVLDWTAVAPYSVTLAILVTVPSVVSILYIYSFIFRNLRNPDSLEDNQKTLLENDPTYAMTFFIILAFGVSWAPYFSLQAFQTLTGISLKSKILHFTLLWLAIGGSCWKLVIYCTMSHEFRANLSRSIFCTKGKKRVTKKRPLTAQSRLVEKNKNSTMNHTYSNTEVATSKNIISMKKTGLETKVDASSVKIVKNNEKKCGFV